MNSCHRIHHSGIHAVFSFVHLLLVSVICFDTLLPIYYLRLFWDLFLCFLLELTHTCIKLDLLHNRLIMLLGPAHTHTHTHTDVTPLGVYTDQNDLLSSDHHKLLITQKQAHHTNAYDCMKLILWNHRTCKNKIERNESKTTRTNFENCTQNAVTISRMSTNIGVRLYSHVMQLSPLIHCTQLLWSTHFRVAVWDALSFCSLPSLVLP